MTTDTTSSAAKKNQSSGKVPTKTAGRKRPKKTAARSSGKVRKKKTDIAVRSDEVLKKGQNAGKNGLNAALKSPVQSLARKVLRVARRKIWQKQATSHEQSAESARPQHPEVQCFAPTERRTGQKQRTGLGIGKGGKMRR